MFSFNRLIDRSRDMKKLLSLMLALVVVVGCAAKDNSFKGKEYKLTDAENGAEITLGFSATENRYFGKAVNNYFGMYTLEGNQITFGPAGSTMMMGPQPMMEAEGNYFKALPMTKTFNLDGKKLTLKTSEGKSLVFEEIGEVKNK